MNSRSSAAGFGALCLLMLVSGFGIPVIAALNSGLARHLSSPAAATAALFLIGLAIAALVTLGTGVPTSDNFRNVPSHLYLGAIRTALTTRRCVGLVRMVTGLYFARRPL